MRHALSEASGPAAAWDRFWFAPANPKPLGLMRIVVGALLLWNMALLGTDLRAFLGSGGWVDQATLRVQREGQWAWSLWDLVPDRMLGPAWVVAMVVLGLFTVGLGSRVAAPLAWAVAVSTTRRNPIILHGFDQIATLWAFYLAATFASGQAYSADRWLARRRGVALAPTVSANVGLRLVQVSLAIIYASAGLAKVGGVSWLDGSAVMKTLGNAEFRPFDLTWMMRDEAGVLFLNLCTHLALWTELLYPILVWKRAFRPWVVGAAVAMHAGIALTMGLTEFSLAMIAGNLAFVRFDRGRSKPPGVESPEGVSADAPATARRARP